MIMTAADIAIIVICCAAVVAVVAVAIVRRKKGKTSCGCGDCASCTACHRGAGDDDSAARAAAKTEQTPPAKTPASTPSAKPDEAEREARRDAFLKSLSEGGEHCGCAACATRGCAHKNRNTADKHHENDI